MKRPNLVPAVLLLSLTAPTATRATPASAQSAASPSVTASADKLASRRSRSQGRDELSASLIEQASAYLRAASNGSQPPAEFRDAWEQFYRSCDLVIRKFAGRIAPRQIDLDDCAQEVWADLLKTLPDFQLDRSRGKFTSWLYTVVRSKATNQLRQQARDRADGMMETIPAIAPASDDPAVQLERQSQRQAVRNALAELQSSTSERSFQVLHLRQMEGRRVSEVAELLGMTPGQVWVTEHRMKRKLRTLLDERL
jgi:RNA polymerase sigma-70 factor (ECF subfamily)